MKLARERVHTCLPVYRDRCEQLFTSAPAQDGDIESVSQSKHVVKLKLEQAPKLCLIIKKPNGGKYGSSLSCTCALKRRANREEKGGRMLLCLTRHTAQHHN